MSEAAEFLKRNYNDFAPVAEDRALLDALRDQDGDLDPTVTPGRVTEALDQLETKIFLSEKPDSESGPGAKRVLLTASETLAANSLAPILDRLHSDRRSKAVGLMTDNVAARLLSGKLEGFRQLCDPEKPMLHDAMRAASPEPFDVALVPVDPRNSPNAHSLYGAKSVFGAKKMYFMATGWVGIGNTDLFEHDRRQQMDEIDGIFCADDLAASIIAHQLPDFPREKILVTGTPVVDAVEPERAEEYTKAGRDKLQLDDETTAVLVMGHISPVLGSASELHPRISERTFALTFHAMVAAAEAKPDRKFALLVRPHPRDPNADELFTIASQQVPENMKVVRASNDVVSMQEATYGADVTASIVGTDNFLAPRRGRQGVFLGYEEPGMGGPLLEDLYGTDIVRLIGEADGLKVAKSPEEFTEAIVNSRKAGGETQRPDHAAGSSVDRIVDVMLR